MVRATTIAQGPCEVHPDGIAGIAGVSLRQNQFLTRKHAVLPSDVSMGGDWRWCQGVSMSDVGWGGVGWGSCI